MYVVMLLPTYEHSYHGICHTSVFHMCSDIKPSDNSLPFDYKINKLLFLNYVPSLSSPVWLMAPIKKIQMNRDCLLNCLRVVTGPTPFLCYLSLRCPWSHTPQSGSQVVAVPSGCRYGVLLLCFLCSSQSEVFAWALEILSWQVCTLIIIMVSYCLFFLSMS